MTLLDRIQSPADLQHLSSVELTHLAQEIRERVIAVTSANGGHIGPNLGVVELTLALHRLFETPRDKFVFDVAHQGYVHKLLTGRNDAMFDRIRQTGGYSGFLNRAESEHDAYGAGHAGTALSAALGMAVARDRAGTGEHVVAVVGDAAFTCGITMEALNNVAVSTDRLIIVLNDNEWSISRNVGALATYFNELITNPLYAKMHRKLHRTMQGMPGGGSLIRLARKWKRGTKDFLVSSNMFETYGVRYVGPIDGHDLDTLTRYLSFAKTAEQPVLLHVMTKKGKGFEPALEHPEKFHGCSPFDIRTGKGKPKAKDTPPNYQDAFGQALLRFAEQDPRVMGITAAMPPGTGLVYLREKLPSQYFDVGIAEEHAVLFAAGLATQGFKPVAAIYSTFLQRAYDPIVHDVCLQNLPVVFCMDRAGLSPNDGATHHGLFDIAYLRAIPNAVVMQPKDEDELTDMLWTGLNTPQPTFIRYPRGRAAGQAIKSEPARLEIGRAEVLRKGDEVLLWALGPWVEEALVLAEEIEEAFPLTVAVVNARFAKPLDTELLARQAAGARLLVTLEDHGVTGGFGSAVLEALQEAEVLLPVERIGWPDQFVEHGSSVAQLRRENGLDLPTVQARLFGRLRKVLGMASHVETVPLASPRAS